MHVRCNNQYKTGADRGNILGQLKLFECIGICVLSPAHESEIRGYFVYVQIVKCLSHCQSQYIRSDGFIVEWGGVG